MVHRRLLQADRRARYPQVLAEQAIIKTTTARARLVRDPLNAISAGMREVLQGLRNGAAGAAAGMSHSHNLSLFTAMGMGDVHMRGK